MNILLSRTERRTEKNPRVTRSYWCSDERVFSKVINKMRELNMNQLARVLHESINRTTQAEVTKIQLTKTELTDERESVVKTAG